MLWARLRPLAVIFLVLLHLCVAGLRYIFLLNRYIRVVVFVENWLRLRISDAIEGLDIDEL